MCDGMGGARAGNVASTMAVELFMEEFFKADSSGPVEERIIKSEQTPLNIACPFLRDRKPPSPAFFH